jgi:hypothetical protein
MNTSKRAVLFLFGDITQNFRKEITHYYYSLPTNNTNQNKLDPFLEAKERKLVKN